MGRKSASLDTRKAYAGKKIEEFCKNVHLVREKRGISQQDVAKLLGVHPSRISQIESGLFPRDASKIRALSAALKCSIGELFGEQQTAPSGEPGALTAKQITITALLDNVIAKLLLWRAAVASYPHVVDKAGILRETLEIVTAKLPPAPEGQPPARQLLSDDK